MLAFEFSAYAKARGIVWIGKAWYAIPDDPGELVDVFATIAADLGEGIAGLSVEHGETVELLVMAAQVPRSVVNQGGLNTPGARPTNRPPIEWRVDEDVRKKGGNHGN